MEATEFDEFYLKQSRKNGPYIKLLIKEYNKMSVFEGKVVSENIK